MVGAAACRGGTPAWGGGTTKEEGGGRGGRVDVRPEAEASHQQHASLDNKITLCSVVALGTSTGYDKVTMAT